jgi:TrmH family RNA methyltransferase
VSAPVLTSPSNPRIKAAAKLRQGRERRRVGRMLVEGRRELARLLASDLAVHATYFDADALGAPGDPPASPPGDDASPEALLAALAARSEAVACGPRALGKLCFRDAPEVPLVAEVDLPWVELSGFRPDGEGPLVLVQRLEKPGNLGALLRSADGAGVAGVLLVDPLVDPGAPQALRSSLGTLFHVPLAHAPSEEARAWLGERGYRVAAATPRGATAYTATDLTGRVALALGSEAHGLDDAWIEGADARVVIPMRGRADSLNLAQSATLLMYEALRQRAGQ